MRNTAAIILSSHRKGSNSSALGLAVAEGFTQAGGRAEIVDISGLDIKPCLGCGACQRNGGNCSQIDGMQTVYPKIKAASALVLVTPVYWFTLSGSLKIFLDRCYALLESDVLAGKTLAAAFSYGAPDLESSGALNAVKTFQDICGHTRSRWGGFVHAAARERDTLAKDEAVLRAARELGQRLLADLGPGPVCAPEPTRPASKKAAAVKAGRETKRVSK